MIDVKSATVQSKPYFDKICGPWTKLIERQGDYKENYSMSFYRAKIL
jgi:hypothetical protein